MEAASKGASEAGGLAVGIVPSADLAQANKYCDVVVATGLGWSRNFVVAYSGDAVIVVGGGAGPSPKQPRLTRLTSLSCRSRELEGSQTSGAGNTSTRGGRGG
jgi:SLOG-like protein